MGTPFERLASWALRSVATATVIAGVGMLVAGIPTWPMTAGTDAPRAIVAILMQMGGLLLVGALVARYFLRGGAPVLPNERITVSDDQRPALGGELLVLALMLIAAPLWLIVRLQPFLAEWRFVWSYIADPQLWDNANANMSGVVLIPLFGALIPPFLQLLTLAGFVMSSAMLGLLLAARSPRLPRLYIASVVLIATVLLASIRATRGATVADDALRQEMARISRTSTAAAEDATLSNALDRYRNAVRTAAAPLAWTWLAYAVWIPLLLGSSRVRLTLANRVDRPNTWTDTAHDVEAVTRPPRFPGM